MSSAGVSMLTPRPDRHRRDVLFLILIGANLLPIVWFSHLPSADGPAHVYNSSLFLRLGNPHDPAWQFVEFNRSLPPNMLTHAVLALLTWLAGPLAAERLLVAGYATAFPLAFRYALRGVSRETHGIEFVGLLLVFNQHLHWGFYNFLAGLVAYLAALGYWLRIRERSASAASAATMAALVAVIYLCHPVPLMAFWATVGFMLAVDVVRMGRMPVEQVRLAAFATAPSLLLYLHFANTKTPGQSMPWEWSSPRLVASMLIRLYPLATYTTVERIAALMISGAVVCAALWAWRSGSIRGAAHIFVWVAGLLAALVFIAPSKAIGGTLVTPRLVYFPLLFVLLWLSSMRWPSRFASGVIAATVVLTVAGHASRWPIYERYERRMVAFLAAAATRDRQPVETFHLVTPRASVNLDSTSTPYLAAGAWGYVAAERQTVLLDYEARLGYFPFRHRGGADPTRFTLPLPGACRSATAELIDEEGFRRATGLTLDTQIVWVASDDVRSDVCAGGYGRQPSAERRNADGTLLWFDSED
jgi:hypothetical protein